MTRLILIFISVCCLLQANPAKANDSIVLTGDIQMRLGDAFMAENEYYRAITEYKKYLILFPEGMQGDTALFKVGMAYYSGLEYDSAARVFNSVKSIFPGSAHASEAAYFEGVCNAKLNRLDKAAAAFETAAVNRSSAEVAPQARLGRALVEFDQGNTTEARNNLDRFIVDFPTDRRAGNVQAGLSLLHQEGDLPGKSPLTAGILSAVIPGSGHIYAEHYGDGATAFLLNGLFIAGTVVAIQQGNYAVAGIVGVIGLPFYAGNIYGAANAATKWNLGVRKGLREKLTVTLDYRF